MKEQFEFPEQIFEGEDFEKNSMRNILKKEEQLPELIISDEKISIMIRGIVVLFWQDENGTKTIIDFKSAGEVLRPAIEIKKEKAGKFYAKALIDSEIISLNRHFFCECSISNKKIADLYYGVLTHDISSTYWQLKLLKEADIEKRYETFLKKYKNIYNQVSDRMIASFLGVHYTTLSRVKHRILEKSRLHI